MEESSDRTSSVLSSGMNNKMNSDSGYGSNSNKSNSQSQRSSGSSKSHQSSLSSGSCSFLSNPIARVPTPSGEPHGQTTLPAQASTSGTMSKPRSEKDYKRKKKSKGKSATGTTVGENNQRLPSTGTDDAKEQCKKMPGPSETPSCASVCNRVLSGGEFSQQASPDGRSGAPPDSKALQMAALTHALSCIKKFRDQDSDMNDDSEEEKICSYSMWNEQFDAMKDELSVSAENCFGAVVSMEDGLVIHITEELTQILGYPKDMWMGRSFMDLIHPKDKMAFASQFTFTGGITFPTGDLSLGQKGPPQSPESFFCRLRQYRGLKTVGFGIVDKTVIFFPFRLTLKLKEIEGFQKSKSSKASKSSQSEVESENSDKKSVYLFIGANRISSAYQYPEEVLMNPDKFITRHSATCQFGHIDSVAVKYLGHLPQDVVGNSVLDYYHPDDLILLKDIYEGVMAEKGKPFKSKPYRFRVYNGTFAMLETDWSCFINPWSWKLEFVIGQHTVLKGPLNPNVFMPPKPDQTISHSTSAQAEENVGESKVVQDQIKQVLAETVTRRISDPLKQRSSRRKKDLSILLEMLLDQIGNNETSDQSESVGSGVFSVLERDSAMLGEISPHHDDNSMSNQSSETPPSYNQLNYRENIERFFLSHPKTTRETDECVDAVKNDGTDAPSGSADEDSKGSPNGSSGSANRQFGSNSGDNYEGCEPMNEDAGCSKKCSLTEDVLYRHNENMEKSMAQKHREARGKNSLASASHKNSRFRHSEVGDKTNLKRTGNLAGWASSGSSRKAHKQPHMDLPSQFRSTVEPQQQNVLSSVNLWPPYSVGLATVSATPTYTSSFDTPVPVSVPGVGIPGLQYMPTRANPPIVSERQQPNSFLCFPNPLRQYVPQPVPYAIPGAPNVMYHSLGTPSVYAPRPPQLIGQPLPSQQIMMGHTGAPMIPGGPILNPMAHMLPTIPTPIRSMGIGPGVGINVGSLGVGTPIPIRPVPTGMNQMSLNVGIPIRTSSLAPAQYSVPVANSTSTSSAYPATSTSSAPSVSTSSGISVPVNSSPIPTKSTYSSGGGGYHTTGNGSSSSPSEEVAKIISGGKLQQMNARNVGFKNKDTECKDFSSSDGFGSNSSSSLYSLLKNGIYSDDCSNNSGGGRDGNDFSYCAKFQSNSDADGDQDMIWENHAEKKEKEQGIVKNSGYRKSGRGKAKLSKPPWLQNVDISRELSFKYQIPDGNLSEILKSDLDKLRTFGNQPSLVDEQLGELYKEMQLEGFASQLNLEEGSSRYSSSNDGEASEDEDCTDDLKKDAVSEKEKKEISNRKTKISRSDYEKIVQVYEENSPFPVREFESKIVEQGNEKATYAAC